MPARIAPPAQTKTVTITRRIRMKLTADDIRLYLLPEVEERMRHYTNLAAGEVSGLGTVEQFDGGFLVTDIFLPRQECSQGGTELDQESVATLLMELDNAGQDPGALKFWWHSHGGLDTFWSRTDEECIDNLANGDYLLSLVTNKRGNVLARLDIFKPVRVTIDQVPVSVRSTGVALLDTCRQEIRDNVNNIPFPFAPAINFPAREPELFPHWGEVQDDLEELEEQFMAGELTWQEYEERLREVGNG
jgi:hypothetical protein